MYRKLLTCWNPLSRPAISLASLSWLTAAWFVLANNYPLWQKLWQLRGGFSLVNVLFIGVTAVLVILLFNALLSLLLWPRLAKPLLIGLLLLSSVVAYFIGHYGVLIDQSMVQNAIETDVRETRDLLSLSLVGYLFFLGMLPAWWIYRVRLLATPWPETLLIKLGSIGLSCLLVMGGIYAFYPDMASIARNHRELRYMLVPSNYVYATARYVQSRYHTPEQIEAIGADARKLASAAQRSKPLLTVIVVGETARADRFSLNGYPRDTNPRLSREAIINFPHVESCGTSTAVSLPCMFSGLTRSEYSDQKGRGRQSLLDVLQHAGFAVQWRDNNSGCKGVCDRVAFVDYTRRKEAGVCREDECYDEVMLGDLQQWIDRQTQDAVLVLHQKGSHGPAYYLRYPPQFAHFTPVCQTSELEKCDPASVGNAFDNTIRYTDHFLAELIDRLKKNSDQRDTAMLYVSDHGESLGENNLFLHGTPYAIAPDTQKRVPMLAWFSDGYRQNLHLDTACLKSASTRPYSHDHLFHSVLGLLEVKSSVYQSKLDLFAACRTRG